MLPPLAISHRAASRLALGVAGIFTIAALAIALCARPFEYGCEYDKYHVMAERVLRRQLPDDVFRPTGYVMLTAAMGLLGAPCFAAAKAIAALAGGATVYACWHIGAQLVRPSVALLACVLTALNPVLQQWSVTAAPDSLFLLGFCLCLLAMLHHRRHPSNATGAAIGLTFACAYFTRYPAIALLPAIAWVLLRSARGHARVAQVASFAAAAGVGLVPHMIVSYRQFRRLFYDENWRNLALRHFGGENDWSYLFDNPFTGVWSVLTHDPWRIAANTLAELLGVEGRGVAEMLFREVAPAAQPALLLLTALGFVPLLRGRQRSLAVVLLLASASYLLLVCATFYALNRVLLPILPACSLALAAAMAWSPRGAGATAAAGQGLARALRALAVAGVVGGLAVASALRIQDFLRHQHRDVVTTTAEFQAAAGRRLTVLSNFEFLDRHTGCELRPMRVTDPQATWTLVAARVASGGINLVALSGVDDPWRFASLMAVAPPANLSLVRRTSDVAVFAVR